MKKRFRRFKIKKVRLLPQFASAERFDCVAVEEPLDVRLIFGDETLVSFTLMRMPGEDEELITGLLFTEGIIKDPKDIEDIYPCHKVSSEDKGNVLNVILKSTVNKDVLKNIQNLSYRTSACGLCGGLSFKFLKEKAKITFKGFDIDPDVICDLPKVMSKYQRVFYHTGGTHSAALFDFKGKLKLIKEDVGRHNALDKVIGAAMRDGIFIEDTILLLSGRIGFELVHKALIAKIPVVVGIGAPTSLSIEFAREFGIVLIGFTKDIGFIIYSGESIIKGVD